jgi:hypothetical protein
MRCAVNTEVRPAEPRTRRVKLHQRHALLPFSLVKMEGKRRCRRYADFRLSIHGCQVSRLSDASRRGLFPGHTRFKSKGSAADSEMSSDAAGTEQQRAKKRAGSRWLLNGRQVGGNKKTTTARVYFFGGWEVFYCCTTAALRQNSVRGSNMPWRPLRDYDYRRVDRIGHRHRSMGTVLAIAQRSNREQGPAASGSAFKL